LERFARKAFALRARGAAARAAALRIVNGQGRLAAVAAAEIRADGRR